MRLLVTGGCGFVMSGVVKHVLETDPEAKALVVDLAPPDELAAEFFAPVEGRLTHACGDVRDKDFLNDLPLDSVTHVVHGATVTHLPGGELEDPARFIDVNVLGTINVLHRLRGISSLIRFVNVSSGAAYGEPTPESPDAPQPEDGPFNPPELYAISKHASEQVARRCGELFSIDVRQVRLSDVFGPMERRTPGRQSMSLPYRMVRALVESRPLRVTEGTLAAGGDFVSTTEIATAIAGLLRTRQFAHDVYNVAFGVFTPITELFRAFRLAAPEFGYEIVGADGPVDAALDPANRRARWNAYSIERIASELGWRPRPLEEQLRDYLEWVSVDPERRCPGVLRPGKASVRSR